MSQTDDNRRTRQKRQAELRPMLQADKHHVLFERHFWTQANYQVLRQDQDLIVLMDRSIHNELHRLVPPVPPPGNNLILRIAKFYFRLQRSDRQKCIDHDSSSVVGIALLNSALDNVVTIGEITPLEVDQIKLIKRNLNAQLELILESEQVLIQRLLASGLSPSCLRSLGKLDDSD